MTRKLILSLAATSLLSLLTISCEQEQDIDESWCLAAPVCASDQMQVDACEADDTSCSEHSICNQTIYCKEIPTSCTAYPTCPEGSVELTQCPYNPAGGACLDCADGGCFEITECGSTITCKSCEELPACPPNRVNVDSCTAEDEEADTCVTLTACGMTFGCKLV